MPRVLADIQIFEKLGIDFLLRWGHVLVGIAWIGLLYYFNFVQVPAFAELEPGTRNQTVDKLASRALWWFRWAAAATLLFGLLLGIHQEDVNGDPQLFSGDYMKTTQGISITVGMLLGITMFLNVWLVIWPNQKKVIANARNVLSGGEADPGAADAGRKALLASRQNVIFSFPMLLFMIGTGHFFGAYNNNDRGIFWAIALVLWAALEANCLFNRGTNLGTWIYENHKRAIGAALVLAGIYYVAWELVFDAV